MIKFNRKTVLGGTIALAIIAAGAVASPQVAGAANGTQPKPTSQPSKVNVTPYGVNCFAWGQCATLSNYGTTAIWVDGDKLDNLKARTRTVPAGFIMNWGNRFPIEAMWLAKGDCAWVRDSGTTKWTSYWGSKTTHTYVPMGDFDMWDAYKKPCGSSS